MPVYNRIAQGLDEVDIIIAGGGTAGCVVAGRISAADPNLSILVIEGGESNYMKDNVIHPALYRENFFPKTKTMIFYKSEKQPQLGDRPSIVPAGGILGGGSSVNAMMYSRASRSDFDSWDVQGWSADELLPHMKNLETFHGSGDKKVHGHDGPVHISDGGFRFDKIQTEVLQAAEKVGYPEFEDLQDLDSVNGFAKWMRYVSPEGKRQDSAHTFVHPLIQDGIHENLHVLCESKVNKVLFDDDKRACGVEYVPNPDYQPMTSETPVVKCQVKARKLVVVSCGACATPSVLERSGVGRRELLEKHGIPVVADLYGVGHDYQDHNLIFYPFYTNLAEGETLDALYDGRIARADAISQKMDLLRINPVDIAGKIRPTDSEIKALGPEFEATWNRDFKNQPDRPLMLMAFTSTFAGDRSLIDKGQYLSPMPFTAYPYSRGSVHIKGKEWSDGADFNPGYFTDDHDIDLKAQLWAYKKQREIMRRTSFYQGEVQMGHPVFPEGSKAACINLKTAQMNGTVNGSHGNSNVKDLEYSAEDDEVIMQFLRERIQTAWHSLGTCKMAPQEKNGVVDKDLNVYGVSGLKCIDLSIVPGNVAANTMNTALVIGEKGADIILGELGLPSPDNSLYKDSKLAYS